MRTLQWWGWDIKSFENPTRHKSREAEHFLSMIKQSFEDDEKFSFNLSAFLSAARSITWYLQKQYAHSNGFTEWYLQNKIKMSADPELKYLNEIRVEDVKREPVKTGTTHAITFGVSVVFGETPSKSEQTKEDESPPIQSSTKIIRRFFPKFGKIDVIEFCENQLKKLNKIVEECEKQFRTREPTTRKLE